MTLSLGKIGWLTAVTGVALVTPLAIADTTLQPSVTATFVHVEESSSKVGDLDGKEAMTITPSLTWTRTGAVWDANLNLEHTEIKHLSNDFEDQGYSNLRMTNKFDWFGGRVSLTADGSRVSQTIDTGFSNVADPIFGKAEFIDVDRLNSVLSFKTVTSRDFQTELSLGVSSTDFDENDLNDTSTNSSRISRGESKQADWVFTYGGRDDGFKANLSANFTRLERKTRGNQDSLNASVSLGLPIYQQLELVASASTSQASIENTILVDNELDHEIFGAGLGWKFGLNSYLSVTYNKDTRGTEDEFVGVNLTVSPNERSTISYEKSKRFYGDSHSFNMSLRGKRYSLTANYAESVGSRTRIERSIIEDGFYICPITAQGFDECEIVDIVPLPLDEGFYDQIRQIPQFSLTEQVTLTKSGSVNLSYKFKRANLSLSYGIGESEFLETGRMRENESASASFTYNMTRRNTLKLSARQSESSGDGDNRKGHNVTLSFDRKMSRKATATFSIVKVKNESTSGIQSREDTRGQLIYNYKF